MRGFRNNISNSNVKMKNCFLIGILGAIIVIAGYLFYQNFQQNNDEITVNLKFNTACQTSGDCKEYISHNTCKLFCANNEEINNEIILSLKITCDSALWDPPFGRDCNCIDNICQFAE